LDFGFWIADAGSKIQNPKSKIQNRGARRIAPMVRIIRRENPKSEERFERVGHVANADDFYPVVIFKPD
jgi:hypothetical protein